MSGLDHEIRCGEIVLITIDGMWGAIAATACATCETPPTIADVVAGWVATGGGCRDSRWTTLAPCRNDCLGSALVAGIATAPGDREALERAAGALALDPPTDSELAATVADYADQADIGRDLAVDRAADSLMRCAERANRALDMHDLVPGDAPDIGDPLPADLNMMAVEETLSGQVAAVWAHPVRGTPMRWYT